MNAQAIHCRRRPRGHTLIELMVAILIGIIIILAASVVMASFEANKRTTTAMNDALQSANISMLQVDTMIRSAGTGLRQYAAVAGNGYGCQLNYVATTGTVSGGFLPTLMPAPFVTTSGTNVVGTGALPLRLVPIVVFPSVSPAEGTLSGVTPPSGSTAGSDIFMVMLGGGGYGESPSIVNSIDPAAGPLVTTTVGFSANETVLVSPGTPGGSCFVTTVAPAFAGFSPLTNVSLPLNATSVGSASLSVGQFILGLGMNTGVTMTTNFYLYGVNSANNSLYNLDLLNSPGTAQQVSDDVVLIKVAFGVDPPPSSGTPTWVLPVANTTVNGNTYDYSPAGLLSGGAAADTALKSIHAIRIAMIVRAPLVERFTAAGRTAITATNSVNSGSYAIFSSLPALNSKVPPITWTPPTVTVGGNYRYREIETTIPLRNSGASNAAL